jgi:hypothetical protein
MLGEPHGADVVKIEPRRWLAAIASFLVLAGCSGDAREVDVYRNADWPGAGRGQQADRLLAAQTAAEFGAPPRELARGDGGAIKPGSLVRVRLQPQPGEDGSRSNAEELVLLVPTPYQLPGDSEDYAGLTRSCSGCGAPLHQTRGKIVNEFGWLPLAPHWWAAFRVGGSYRLALRQLDARALGDPGNRRIGHIPGGKSSDAGPSEPALVLTVLDACHADLRLVVRDGWGIDENSAGFPTGFSRRHEKYFDLKGCRDGRDFFAPAESRLPGVVLEPRPPPRQ